jgi:hypothetical protein
MGYAVLASHHREAVFGASADEKDGAVEHSLRNVKLLGQLISLSLQLGGCSSKPIQLLLMLGCFGCCLSFGLCTLETQSCLKPPKQLLPQAL